MYTYDTSDKTARYLVRGIFSGDGQHWSAIWDRQTGVYVMNTNGSEYFRTDVDAVLFGQRYIPDFGTLV